MTEESKVIPEEFSKVIKDFVGDLKITFPEYESFISKWWKEPEHFKFIDNEEDRKSSYEKSISKSTKLLFDFCKKKRKIWYNKCFFIFLNIRNILRFLCYFQI